MGHVDGLVDLRPLPESTASILAHIIMEGEKYCYGAASHYKQGSSYKDCGHPCERHTLHLRDGQAQDHLVLADMGCRNTVFNAQVHPMKQWLMCVCSQNKKNHRRRAVCTTCRRCWLWGWGASGWSWWTSQPTPWCHFWRATRRCWLVGAVHGACGRSWGTWVAGAWTSRRNGNGRRCVPLRGDELVMISHEVYYSNV